MPTEDTKYTADTDCTSNFTCTNDLAPDVAVSPAKSAAPGCHSNTTTRSSDATVVVGSLKRASQMTKLHNDIKDEITRHRFNPSYSDLEDTVAGKPIDFSKSMARIKENLRRLTGYTLPVNAGDLMRASDIQTAYQRLNTAQNTCICVERCTCNARTAEVGCECDPRCSGVSDNTCECVTVCDCETRNACECDDHCGHRSGAYCIDGKCGCESRTGPGWGTTCPARCTCNSNNVTECQSRCDCDTRTTVECKCNVRNVCSAYVV